MTYNLYENLLKNKGITLDQENITLLQDVLIERTIKKEDYFLREGEKSTEIGFVVNGLFRSFYIDDKGNDVTKYFYPEKSTLFSYVAYLTDKMSAYDIQALEDSRVFVIKTADLDLIMENNYQLLLLFKKLLDEVLIMKEEHAINFKMMDNVERYQHFTRQYPTLEHKIKQHQLASYLGITPVSLSRIRKRLKINKC